MENTSTLPGTSRITVQTPYSTPRLKFCLEQSLTPEEEGDIKTLDGTVIRKIYFYLFMYLFPFVIIYL